MIIDLNSFSTAGCGHGITTRSEPGFQDDEEEFEYDEENSKRKNSKKDKQQATKPDYTEI